MREIKFKLLENGIWLYRNLTDRNWYDFENKCVRGAHPDDRFLDIKQFTGLFDKYENEIYEGDDLTNIHGDYGFVTVKFMGGGFVGECNKGKHWFLTGINSTEFERIHKTRSY